MNKKGFVARDVVITGLIFTGIVALLVLGITGFNANYDEYQIVNDDLADNYNKLNDIADDVDLIRSASQSDEGLSLLGTFDTLFSSTFTVIRMVFATVDLYGNIASSFVSDFTFLDTGVIKILFLMGLSILITILVFVWISALTKGDL